MVSPDTTWVKWLVIVAALVQSVAAVIQVSQGRRRSDGRQEAAKPSTLVDNVMRWSVLSVVLGFMAPYVAQIDVMALDDEAEILHTLFLGAALIAPFITIVLALMEVFESDETPIQVVVHLLEAVAAAAILIMVITVIPWGP
ncbi:hypothetical protein ACIBJE_28740 [Micromonospora sp. NPDC050187]|uniref:hypothetical protein n=1 Tax=Micromonospora sp. NPDC050187 TaxID=3364277 RepID=UPI0037922A38